MPATEPIARIVELAPGLQYQSRGHRAAPGLTPISQRHNWRNFEAPKGRHLIEVKSSDLTARIGKPAVYDDAFQAIVLKAGRLTETVYPIDKAGGWADKQNQQARELVLQQLAGGADIYTAWVKSGESKFLSGQRTSPNGPRNTANPLSPGNPRYNPKTGSAPAVKP